MNYWFFFSYARLDRDDFLKKFFEDLKASVRDLSGELDEDEVGFFDAEGIEPGAQWPETLAGALQSSRAFVSLFSPTYFQKEYCGKEWTVFCQRQEQFAKEHGVAPGLILPVLWMPESSLPKLPPSVGDIQYKHDDFGAEYAKRGLKQLIKISKFKDDYLAFVEALAGRIVAAVKGHGLPPLPNLPSLDKIPSASHLQAAAQADAPLLPITSPGPRYVQFVYVAENNSRMSELRKKLDGYGPEGGKDWKPFTPAVNRFVASMALEVIAQHDFFYDDIQWKDDLIEELEKAEDEKKIVVLVVDTWTLNIKERQEILRKYDDRSFVNCVVLIPWNDLDEEAQQYRETLEGLVKQVFFKRMKRFGGEHSFLYPISSSEDFKNGLVTALYKTRDLILEQIQIEGLSRTLEPKIRPIMTGSGG